MSEDWVPPGYVSSAVLVRERGVDEVRSDLFEQRLQAHKWNAEAPSLHAIEPNFWLADDAESTLTTGLWREPRPDHLLYYRIIVRVEAAKPPHPAAGAYLPPYIELMLDAVRHFGISAEDWRKKEDLVEHFKAQTLPDGTPVSANHARQLATFCRPLAAKRGGNMRKKGYNPSTQKG